jgi:AcrR family transcriptional regulator
MNSGPDDAVRTSLEDRFIAAGLRVLAEHGAAELTVRRVAELAGSSTMGIYTHFGGRTGMLEAIYRRGFDLLRDALLHARDSVTGADPGAGVVALVCAYRDFALANPTLYALLFERPLPDFAPSIQARHDAMAATFTLLEAEVPGGVRPAYLIWTTIHGLVSIELTHAARDPLPGWFIDSPEAGRQILLDGLRALLNGLHHQR